MSENSNTTDQTNEAPEQSLDDFEKELFNSETVTETAEETEEVEEGTVEEEDTASTEDTQEEETAEEESEEETAEEEDDDQKPQKKNRAQERIEELNAKFRAEERKAQEQEQKARELEERLRKIEEGSDKDKKPDPQPSVEGGAPDPDAVDENGDKIYPLGKFDPQFNADFVKYTVAEELKREREEAKERETKTQREQAQAELQNQWEEKIGAAQERYPDYLEKGQELVNSFSNLDQGYAEYLTTTIQRMDAGEDVFYHLASNPELAHAIVNKGPALAGIELGKLAAQLQGPSGSSPSAQTKVTKAPPPPPKARGSAPPKKKDILNDLSDFESEFFKG